ncbi:MAG TPA: hypothetical protein VMB51_08250 [Solirubrobacteraceae bacterium]|nr:hypothetical protein [Solirubrobacteraceae bacterium]
MASRSGRERETVSVARHLARGAIGFGLIGSALALAVNVGPAGLLLVPAGLIVLRGCPACWLAGLVETVTAGRVVRACPVKRDGGLGVDQ